jgi:hypothetical protein
MWRTLKNVSPGLKNAQVILCLKIKGVFLQHISVAGIILGFAFVHILYTLVCKRASVYLNLSPHRPEVPFQASSVQFWT